MIDIRAGVDEQLEGFSITEMRGPEQSGIAVFIEDFEIRAEFDELLHDARPAVIGGKHERGDERFRLCVDIGSGFELQAITAAVIGGAQLLGGRGSVPATIAGALALEAIFTLLNLLGLSQPVRLVVQGLILIGAVAFATYQRKRVGR